VQIFALAIPLSFQFALTPHSTISAKSQTGMLDPVRHRTAPVLQHLALHVVLHLVLHCTALHCTASHDMPCHAGSSAGAAGTPPGHRHCNCWSNALVGYDPRHAGGFMSARRYARCGMRGRVHGGANTATTKRFVCMGLMSTQKPTAREGSPKHPCDVAQRAQRWPGIRLVQAACQPASRFTACAAPQGHAGTVPMPGRQDALAAAAAVVSLVEGACGGGPAAAAADGAGTGGSGDMLVCTVGELHVWPGASNVIAGQVIGLGCAPELTALI
jgi:hypothetical protein